MKIKPKISEDVYEVDLYTDLPLIELFRMRGYDHVNKRLNTDWFDDYLVKGEEEAFLKFLSFGEEISIIEAKRYLVQEDIIGAGLRELAAFGADCPEIFKSAIQVFSLARTSIKSIGFEEVVPVLFYSLEYGVFDTRPISDVIPRDAHVLIHAPPFSRWG